MSWLAVVKVTVPEGVILWQDKYLDRSARFKEFLETNGLIFISVDGFSNTENTYVMYAEYYDRQMYEDLQVSLQSNQDWLFREQYNLDNNIVQETVYTGPKENYDPLGK
jgi:hypothetical protein